MAKEKKDNRKTFRITEQINQMLADTARRIGLSENELVSTALFDVLSNRSNFYECSNCKQYIAYKAIIPASEGIGEFPCECGTTSWIDLETDKVVKTKKAS